jgi:hypothetical protein
MRTLEEELDDSFSFTDCSAISVQELYRPVRSEKVNPELPKVGSKEHSWWVEQIGRCLNGWIAPDGRYINGYHYFLINFVDFWLWDDHIAQFKWVSPFWRDNDSLVMDMIWYGRKRLERGVLYTPTNHIEAKARGKAWTVMTLAIKLYFFVFHNDAPVGSAYPDDENVDKERELFIGAWQRLHPVFRSHNGEMLDVLINNGDQFHIGIKSNSKIKEPHAVARFDIIANDAGAGIYKGDRMNLMIAVEAGKWQKKRLNNYISENGPSAGLGKTKWGRFLIGGTSNAIVNNSTSYRDLFFGPDAWNATAHFTPHYMVLPGFINEFTGKSDTEGAKAFILEERRLLEGNASLYQQQIVENPLNPKEAFIPSTKSAYNNSIIFSQMEFIDDNGLDKLWERGNLVWQVDANRKRTGRVEFQRNGAGGWLINMEGLPNEKYENLHIAGIDDVYKSHDPDKKRYSDASKNAMIVYRQATIQPIKSDMPVGIYLDDPGDINDAYEEFYKGMIFWNIKQTMYEYNSEAFPNWLRTKHELGRLYYINGNKLPGIKILPKVKTELTALGSAYLHDGSYLKNTSKPILESMTKWAGATNTDIGSAFHLVLLLRDLTKNYVVTEVNEDAKSASEVIKLGEKSTLTHILPKGEYIPGGFLKLGVRKAV